MEVTQRGFDIKPLLPGTCAKMHMQFRRAEADRRSKLFVARKVFVPGPGLSNV